MWRVTLAVPVPAAPAFEAALAEVGDSVCRFVDGADTCRLEALCAAEPDRAALRLGLALAAAASGTAPPAVAIERLAARDWLALSRERFAPFRIGRFHIQEPEDETPVPPAAIPLRIEAGAAFGSGRHGSTAGCLLALQEMRGETVRRAADVGCGSAILAIAAAKLWPAASVLASDVDPQAVRVARENLRLNGVAARVRTVAAAGWRAPELARWAPYDLVLCNILARPLKRLARDLARHLAPGGTAVLAGLLVRSGRDVLAVHRAAGLRLVRTIDIDGWRTLVLRRPDRSR